MSASHSTPVFKIERREVLEQRRAEKKKLTALVELATAELVIGTRSSVGLVLDDPIAAGRHCSIAFKVGQFHLTDLENASGTFLNGVRVTDTVALSDGDRIALGVTVLEISHDPTQPHTLTVGVREGAFFHTVKKRGEFASDADEWVRSEVTFGRTPRLVLLNVLVVAGALAAAGWLTLRPGGKAALQPGPLADHHAALFSDQPPSDPRLAAMVLIAQEQGCAACHDSFERPSAAKCANCHGDLVTATAEHRVHPFAVDQGLSCIECHQEHYGAEPPLGTLKPAVVTTLCVDCHGNDFQDQDDLRAGIARAEQEQNLTPSTSAPAARLVSQGYEAFDHGAHSAITDCSVCHVAPEGGLNSAMADGVDFARLTFESCMGCHGPDAQVTGTSLPPTEARWQTTWHGTDDGGQHCRQCHLEPFEGGLATLERAPHTGVAFGLSHRSHGEFMHGSGSGAEPTAGPAAGPGDCAECHKSGEVLWAGRRSTSRVFRHEQHLSALRPGDDAARALVNGQCAQCHADMAGSSTLIAAPAVYLGPPQDSCAECHREEDLTPLITEAGSAVRGSAMPSDEVARATPNFPHDLHTSVEGSCLACHEFEAGTPTGDQAARLTTPGGCHQLRAMSQPRRGGSNRRPRRHRWGRVRRLSHPTRR